VSNLIFIQCSPKGSGSTVLANILQGFLDKGRPLRFEYSPEDASDCNGLSVIKTHNMDYAGWEARFPSKKILFVSSSRKGRKFDKIENTVENQIIIEYENLLESDTVSVDNIVSNIYDRVVHRTKRYIKLDKKGGLSRILAMNKRYAEIKDYPFQFLDHFYHIHGSHRGFKGKRRSYKKVTGTCGKILPEKMNFKLVKSKDKFIHGAWDSAEKAIKENLSGKGILFHSFLEDTFNHSISDPNLENAINSLWVGITHNPIDSFKWTKQKRYRFNGEGFIQSMKYCKGLFCMSISESEKWKKYLTVMRDSPNNAGLNRPYDFTGVKIESLLHPARDINVRFSWEDFCKNKTKRLIQSGYWLRKVYSIYKLDTHYNKGTDFEWHKTIKPFDKWNSQQLINCCRNDRVRIENWRKQWVTEMERTEHCEYEELLASNVFYLDVYDITSNNTIIDCITASTPVLVNRHPSTEEYLGKDYPLFFDNKGHAEEILTKPELIRDAHIYLKNKDKSKFEYSHFVESIYKSEIYKSLENL